MSYKLIASASVVALLAGVAVSSSTAQAGDRWFPRHHRHVYYPPAETYYDNGRDDYYYDDQDDSDYAYYGDEPSERDVDAYFAKRKWRKQQQQTKWWQEDEQDASQLEPVYENSKKRQSSAKTAQKQPVLDPARAAARKEALRKALAAGGDQQLQTASVAPVKVVPKAKPVITTSAPAKLASTGVDKKTSSEAVKKVAPAKPVQTASLDKKSAAAAPAGKTIGCTAGAAVVTGYGFGAVKPRTCTGDTYAYNAARDGKSYVISLKAASGEIIDVKKVQ